MDDDTPLPGGPARLEARERVLAEFLREWLIGSDLDTLVKESARRLRAILETDRLAIYFVSESAGEMRLVSRASDSAPGIAPLPVDLRALIAYPAARRLVERGFSCEDVLEVPEFAPYHEAFRAAGTCAALSTPIRIGGEFRGIVVGTMMRWHARRFRPGEAAFLETAVAYLSAALRDAELLAQLSRERDRQQVLFDVAAAVQRATTVPDLTRTVLALLKEPLGFPLAAFGLLSPDGRTMTAAGAYGDAIGEDTPFPPLTLVSSGPKALGQQALESEEPVVIDDVAADPRAAASRERLLSVGARSAACVALRVPGRLHGVLMVGTGGARIAPEDVRTLRSLASFVSVALDQRRSAEEADRATREARALSEASRALLTRTASRDVLLEQVIDAVVRFFREANCRLLLVDHEREALVDVARRGDWPGLIAVPPLPLGGPGLTVHAARSGEVVNVGDVRSDPRYVEGWPSARSELVVPLRIDDEVVGVIDLQSTERDAFGPDEARLLSAFADRAALAVRLAGLVGALEERTRALEAVTRATRLLNFRLQAPGVLASLVEEAGRTFPGADGAAALVADERGATLTLAATYGVARALHGLSGDLPQPSETFPVAARAFHEDRAEWTSVEGVDELLAGHPPEARARVHAALGDAEIRHILAVPIHVGERRLGVLEVISSGARPFDARDAETLSLLADHAAIALRNARTVEELQLSNRLKDDFLANLSHEVRTPLTGIVGWCEVLLDARGDDPETRRALQAILGQAETLSRMLADLIDLSRIDNFGLELRHQRVSLAEVTRAALDTVAPGAAKRNVNIVADVPDSLAPVEGDPARLQQVVWNLLTNAVKFSPAGATVRVEAHREADGGLSLSVEDRGSGIDTAFLPHVFERFRQEETSFNRRFGGLGIGLAIARAIVEAHDATIEASSEGRDKGCRFTVRFPRERVARSSGAFPRPARIGAPQRLLLVEPDAGNRLHVARLCQSLGFETTAVPGAAEALATAARSLPDVLLADVALADAPGGLLHAWKELPGADRTRCVALADRDVAHVRRQAAQAGFREVVARPVRRLALQRALLPVGTGDAP